MTTYLSINFLPHAIYRPENCIRTTLEAAAKYDFPLSRIIFEVTEAEQVEPAHLQEIISYYRGQGFLTAIDDFGAGYAGLGLLCDFKPDLVKIDMKLIRNIDKDRKRQVILKSLITACIELEIQVIAEESNLRRDVRHPKFGVYLFQGYYFAKPAFQSLPTVPKELLSGG